jgi:hypothetical protein
MEPLEKLDLIFTGVIAQKKREVQIGTAKGMNPGFAYLNGIENQITAYENALAFVRQIKRNVPSMADEVVLKMYG